jgi:hypothetical protein
MRPLSAYGPPMCSFQGAVIFTRRAPCRRPLWLAEAPSIAGFFTNHSALGLMFHHSLRASGTLFLPEARFGTCSRLIPPSRRHCLPYERPEGASPRKWPDLVYIEPIIGSGSAKRRWGDWLKPQLLIIRAERRSFQITDQQARQWTASRACLSVPVYPPAGALRGIAAGQSA